MINQERRVLIRSVIPATIAAPMVGGMVTAPLLSMFVIPVAYLLMRGRASKECGRQSESALILPV